MYGLRLRGRFVNSEIEIWIHMLNQLELIAFQIEEDVGASLMAEHNVCAAPCEC